MVAGDVKFPPEFTRIRHAQGPKAVARDSDLLSRQPFEACVRQVGLRAGGQDIARVWTVQGQSGPVGREIANRDIRRAPMCGQVIQQPLFEEGGANEIEPILVKLDHGGFQLDPAAPVQHMGERDAAGLLWQTVGGKPVEQRARVRARNLDLGKGRNIHDPGGAAHGGAFGRHHVMHRGSAKTIVIALFDTAREPARALVAIDLFVYRALFLEPIIER